MPLAEVVATLTRYARLIDAPVRTGTTVQAVRAAPEGFEIRTNDDVLCARAVVLATGACNLPAIPRIADAIPSSMMTLTPLTYRDPGQLPDGGVLVVGASATGVQLAEEIHESGHPVTIAVGEHVRLPRTYRGRDIFWWLDATGLLAERYDEIDDLTRARHLPSPQLTGTSQASITDLNRLAARGVRIAGRLGRITHGLAQFSGSLPQHLLPRRPENEPFPEPGRSMGHGDRDRRRAPATTPLRTHPCQSPGTARARPDQPGDQNRAMGDRLPARPLLA